MKSITPVPVPMMSDPRVAVPELMVLVVPAGHKFPAWGIKAQRNVVASKVWMKFMMG